MADQETVVVQARAPSLPQTAAVEFFVDIYPFEGGPFTFSAGEVLRVTTNKSLNQNVGSFEIVLAPKTLANNLSWGQIITTMSFVVIAMRRAGRQAITMLGVVTAVSEGQAWNQGSPVERTIRIVGSDLAYFLARADYATLWYLAAVGQASIGLTMTGLLAGDPGDVAKAWYMDILAGKVFKDTVVPYKGARIKFPDLFGTQFDKYDVTVPYGDFFLGTNDTWFAKFQKMLPFPYYEFFVVTDSMSSFQASGGYRFTSVGLGESISATPKVIARKLPLPQITTTTTTSGATFGGISTEAWLSLQTNNLGGQGFIESQISFTENETYNFYSISPTWAQSLYGANNGTTTPWLFSVLLARDLASIARFGYRPMIQPISWYADLEGSFAISGSTTSGAGALGESLGTLLGRLAGYYEGASTMASALVRTVLRPDIQVGTKFTYQPFRSSETWDFYVEGVVHECVYGGQSSTRLFLSRGLPSSVYGNTQLLLDVHKGNAQRIGGSFQSGLPPGSPSSLEALTPVGVAQWNAEIVNYYTTPQAVSGAP